MLTEISDNYVHCSSHSIRRLRERFDFFALKSNYFCMRFLEQNVDKSEIVIESREKHHRWYGRTARYYRHTYQGTPLEMFFIVSPDNIVVTVLTKIQFLALMEDTLHLKRYHALLYKIANA
jgi:hypothetical protein